MMTDDRDANHTPGGAAQTRRKRLALRVLLIGSLTLNVVILGLVAGAFFSFKRHDGPRMAADRFTAPFVRALSEEDRRAVGRDIRRSFRAASVDRGGDEAHYLDALSLLRQTPFDAEALRAEMLALDEAGGSRRRIARESFLARIAGLSDAERAAYADRLEAELERGAKRGHRDGHHKKHGPKTE